MKTILFVTYWEKYTVYGKVNLLFNNKIKILTIFPSGSEDDLRHQVNI